MCLHDFVIPLCITAKTCLEMFFRLFPLPITVCCKPRDRLKQKPPELRRVFLSISGRMAVYERVLTVL